MSAIKNRRELLRFLKRHEERLFTDTNDDWSDEKMLRSVYTKAVKELPEWMFETMPYVRRPDDVSFGATESLLLTWGGVNRENQDNFLGGASFRAPYILVDRGPKGKPKRYLVGYYGNMNGDPDATGRKWTWTGKLTGVKMEGVREDFFSALLEVI